MALLDLAIPEVPLFKVIALVLLLSWSSALGKEAILNAPLSGQAPITKGSVPGTTAEEKVPVSIIIDLVVTGKSAQQKA